MVYITSSFIFSHFPWCNSSISEISCIEKILMVWFLNYVISSYGFGNWSWSSLDIIAWFAASRYNPSSKLHHWFGFTEHTQNVQLFCRIEILQLLYCNDTDKWIQNIKVSLLRCNFPTIRNIIRSLQLWWKENEEEMQHRIGPQNAFKEINWIGFGW